MKERVYNLLLILALTVVSSPSVAQNHLTFAGIPINGSFSSFEKKLLAAKFKHEAEYDETSFPAYWGKPSQLLGYECGLYIKYDYKTGTVWRVVAAIYDEDQASLNSKYAKLKEHFSKQTQVHTEYNYFYDDKDSEDFGIDVSRSEFFMNHGTITLTLGTDLDSNPSIFVTFSDDANTKLYSDEPQTNPTIYDLSGLVTCARNCVLSIGDYETKLSGYYNSAQFIVEPVGQDQELIKELMAYNGKNDVKSMLLNTYVYSIIRDYPINKSVIRTRSRMEKVIYAYVDAQRKLQAQKRPTMRGILWGALKDYLFTKDEKELIDRSLPKNVQEQLFMGIFNAVGGSGQTQWDMLSPAQQAVIHEHDNAR